MKKRKMVWKQKCEGCNKFFPVYNTVGGNQKYCEACRRAKKQNGES